MEKLDLKKLSTYFTWIVFAVIIGCVFGFIGGIFARATLFVVDLRMNNPLILLLLPFGAILVTWLYKKAGFKEDPSASIVIASLNHNKKVPLILFPLIFFSAIFSHLCGASVGRVSSTIQLGGSLGQYIADKAGLDYRKKNILIMCAVSAVFSALFGTPMAGAFLTLEMSFIGIIRWYALPFTLISSYVGRLIGSLLGIPNNHFDVAPIPALTPKMVVILAFLAGLTAILSIIYCLLNQNLSKRTNYLIKNPYLRAFVIGTILLVLTHLSGGQEYNATGAFVVKNAFIGDVAIYAFLLKLLFTFLSITAGYKGGEVFPAIFIGATFGSAFGVLLGLPVGICAAVGLGAMFCGITNCPVTSFMLCIELFGGEGAAFYLVTIAVSFVLSGRCSLYSTQEFGSSKFI